MKDIDKLQQRRSHPPPPFPVPCVGSSRCSPHCLHIVFVHHEGRRKNAGAVPYDYESPREPDMERAEKSTGSLWVVTVRKKKSRYAKEQNEEAAHPRAPTAHKEKCSTNDHHHQADKYQNFILPLRYDL